MKRLVIKSLGPVTSIDIELTKVNLIIGPQSSGKSTVNKYPFIFKEYAPE